MSRSDSCPGSGVSRGTCADRRSGSGWNDVLRSAGKAAGPDSIRFTWNVIRPAEVPQAPAAYNSVDLPAVSSSGPQ